MYIIRKCQDMYSIFDNMVHHLSSNNLSHILEACIGDTSEIVFQYLTPI